MIIYIYICICIRIDIIYVLYRALIIDELLQEKWFFSSQTPPFFSDRIGSDRAESQQCSWAERWRCWWPGWCGLLCPDTGLDTKYNIYIYNIHIYIYVYIYYIYIIYIYICIYIYVYIYIYLAWGYLALKSQIPQQEIGKWLVRKSGNTRL